MHDGVSGTVLRTVGVKASVTCFNAIPIPVEILVLSLVVISFSGECSCMENYHTAIFPDILHTFKGNDCGWFLQCQWYC